MKVLNLYAGIGGNRRLWEGVEVTAVELNPKIAEIYQEFFPKDKVIVADAHEFLLGNFEDYDFIWSSPPCPTHSKIRIYSAVARGQNEPVYPDMNLYQEIILLKHYFKGRWVVENVIGFYEPLIRPSEICRHYFWSNFHIGQFKADSVGIADVTSSDEVYGINLDGKDCGHRKDQVLRNQVNPHLGLHILNYARKQEDDLFKISQKEL